MRKKVGMGLIDAKVIGGRAKPLGFPSRWPFCSFVQWYGKSQTTNDLIFWKVDHLAALQWKAWPAGTWASPNMTLILLLFPLATSVHGTLSKRKTASGCLKHWWPLDPLGSENRSGSNPWVSPSLTSMLYPVTNLDGWKHTFYWERLQCSLQRWSDFIPTNTIC